MLDSRNIDDLRPDVAHNCRVFLERCREAGLQVLITQTRRDDEYQATLYAQGRTAPGSIVTNSRVTTFHGVGLAFDFCRDRKGHEYDDPAFFERAAAIGKDLGFSWGGDWRSFPDRPHLQWDAGGKYTGAQVRAGALPPEMEEHMTKTEFAKMMDAYLADLRKKPAPAWAGADLMRAKTLGITDGTAPCAFVTRAEAAIMAMRAKGA